MSKFHRLPIARVDRETRDAVAITFAVPPALAGAFRFEPGQHLSVRADIGGADVRRTYSICAAPAGWRDCASPSSAIPAACSRTGRTTR